MPTSIFGSGRIRKWMACLFVHYSMGVPSLWEKNGRWFRLYDRRTKQSGSFLSNMDYAQVSAAVVTQSLSMVFRTGTWLRWHENIPTAFSYAACASTSSCHGIKLFRQTIQIKYFLQKELDIRGSCNALPADFRAVICYMKQGTCPKDEFISKVATPETAL